MKKATLVAFSMLLFVFAFAVSASFAEKHEGTKETVEGNIVCLIPDYQKGTVNPVIATGPCNELPPHHHLLVSKDGKVYSLQGLQEGLMALQSGANHTDVKVTGRVEQNPGGWILYVE